VQTTGLNLSDGISPPSTELTHMLLAAHEGGHDARTALLGTIYGELRSLARAKLARESPLTMLNPTSLVHESYVRLMGNSPTDVTNRKVFFSYASKVMRSVIVDYVRERDALKRGGGASLVTLLTEMAGETVDETQVLAIDQAMEKLREIDQRCHDVVELRYFGGFTLEECAEQLQVSTITVGRDWEKARLFLAYQLAD
jgi:RNA polymerase sigma factor (TIGR02999 family)